jgi:CAAX protease family protein
MPSRKSPLKFFLLVFALSLPFWLAGAIAAHFSIGLPFNLPLSALMLICPVTAAVILVHREDGPGSARRLLRRAFDYRRIRRKIWYAPIILTVPVIYLLSYQVLSLMGRPLPEPHIPLVGILALLVVFFIEAAGEELGWMGYAIAPLQHRWNALTASIILGLVWAIWHVVPDLEAHHTMAWIGWQRFYTVALRILIVWIFNNTGHSVFAAILVHDTEDLSYALSSSHYDPAVTAVTAAITAVIVTFLWGTKTLARYRYGTGGMK